MWRYRNANTGDVVDLEQRDPCLDMLPNWSATPLGAAPPAAPAVPVAGAAGRPPENANKSAWIAYAVTRGMDERDARALSKAALIEEFGENSDNNDEGEERADGQD
ncbi:hypothetical protein [Nonomuraea sp. NPDC050786]|uniref:hypothetical protein n=1 Tax=Nonomuraea sp. NPDC050786 TaxID=3154840 RepID=UPI0033FE8C2F